MPKSGVSGAPILTTQVDLAASYAFAPSDYFADVTDVPAGGTSIELPDQPSTGDWYAFVNTDGSAGPAAPIVLQASGAPRLQGGTASMTFATPGAWAIALYLDFANLWAIFSGAAGASPNVVQFVNTSASPAANTITLSAPPIARQGSGRMRVTGNCCPYPTGAPSTIGFSLLKDGVALGPLQFPLPSGPGGHTPVAPNYVDTAADFEPHVYAILQTPSAGQIADSANHQWITVEEIAAGS